ncbi:MAG: hypothetical protein J6C23_06490 [Clostridia bacterium]|nr:hypothetical protein [Clostridia bacterium]
MSKKLFEKVKINRVLIILFVLFFCAVFFIPSVVNRDPQIQTKLLITAIGVDRTENGETEFSGIAVLPESGEQAKVRSVTVTNVAASLSECIENVSEQYGKQVELGLCGLVVFGESTDNESILPDLEFLLSSALISPGTYLIHTAGNNASELLDFASSQNPSTAEILSSVVEFNDKTARITTRTLLEFLSESHSLSGASVIPSVRVSEKLGAKESGDEGKGSGEAKSKDSKKSAVQSLTTAVMYKNGKNIGSLTEEQTLGFNLATSQSDKGLLVIDNLEIDGTEMGRIDCWVYSSSFSNQAVFVNGVPVFGIKIEVILQFQDQHKIIRAWQKNGYKEEEVITPIIKGFEEKIKSAVLSAYEKAKTVNADIFNVKTEFSRYHCNDYKKIQKTDDVFLLSKPKVEVKVSFK